MLLALLPMLTNAQIQSHQFSITGRVIDSVNQKPLDYVTVTVLDQSDKALASGLTDDQGVYKLQVHVAGSLRIVCIFIGYARKEWTVTTIAGQHVWQIKDMHLVPMAKELGEVQIKGKRKLLIQKPGMLVYNAGNDPSNKGGTAADVLRKAPVLSVDAAGNVSMRGSGNIKILVDGKYSGQMARSPADALNMMPADAIESVEVITTPSAKYDSEGAAGVINIITKKGNKQLSGALEAVASNWEQAFNPRVSAAGKKLKFNANAHLHRLRTKSTSDYQRVNLDQGSPTSSLQQQIVRENVAPHGSVSFTAEYNPDTLNQLSIGVTSWFGNWPDNSRRSSKVFASDNTLSESYEQIIDSRGRYWGGDINLGYTHKFKKTGRELTLLIQMSPSRDHSDYRSDQNATGSNTLLYRELNNNLTQNREWTFQADYLHPLGKDSKHILETGAKMIRRRVGSNYKVQGSDTGKPDALLPVTERSDIFNYSQDVLAGYVILRLNLPRHWYLESGARLEGTFIEGKLTSTGTSFSKDFANLVPTATLSKKLGDTRAINLSYTKRLTRPYIWDLNPNVNASDPKNISIGNPQLQPEVTHQAELAYSISINSGLTLNPALFWKQTNNSILEITAVEANGISVTSKQNVAGNQQLGFNLSASAPISKRWTTNFNTNISRLNYNSTALQIVNQGWGAGFNVNTTYKLPLDFSVQAFGAFHTRSITLQGYHTGSYYYTFAAKKELKSQNITISLSTANPFSRSVMVNDVINTSTFSSSSVNGEYYQSVKFTVGWAFGKVFKQSEGKRINNEDIKGQPKG